MDWDDPAERFRLADRVGPDEYNRLFAEHMRASVVATVNGYDIRPVMSQRFGRIFMVDGTDTGYPGLEQAKDFASRQPPKQAEDKEPAAVAPRM
jgi:hypothetical protein